MSAYSVETENLGKAYRTFASPKDRLVQGLTLGRRKTRREFWALRHLDLALSPGMVLGICGANGAGKSTLLKMLAGTSSPSEGRFRTRGRVTSLLDLGLGFHKDLSGRSNLLHNGILHGYGRREMDEKIEEIVEFSELGGFIEEPVRAYSSGMGMRLGFSIAAVLDPDVLILDEVFSVGDIRFQQKCMEKIGEFRRRNKTILFCSHSMFDLRHLCDQTLWLHEGLLAARGDTVSVTGAYVSFMRGFAEHVSAPPSVGEGAGGTAAGGASSEPEDPRIRGARIYRMDTDEETSEIETGDSIEVRVSWEKPAGCEDVLSIGVGLFREDKVMCAGVGTHLEGIHLEGQSGCMSLRLPNLPLLSGSFLVAVWLLDEGGVHRYQDYILDDKLVVRANAALRGVFRPRHEWIAGHDPPD